MANIDAFHSGCLCKICRIFWHIKISNVELHKTTGCNIAVLKKLNADDSNAFKQLDARNNWRYGVRWLRYDQHTKLVRFGAFIVNNLHPKP